MEPLQKKAQQNPAEFDCQGAADNLLKLYPDIEAMHSSLSKIDIDNLRRLARSRQDLQPSHVCSGPKDKRVPVSKAELCGHVAESIMAEAAAVSCTRGRHSSSTISQCKFKRHKSLHPVHGRGMGRVGAPADVIPVPRYRLLAKSSASPEGAKEKC